MLSNYNSILNGEIKEVARNGGCIMVLCSHHAKDFSGLYSHLETTNVQGIAEDISAL